MNWLCRYWCLKEAYVKALGSGLTDELNKVEFYHSSGNNISAHMDGKVMTEWRFWLFELGDRHCVSSLSILIITHIRVNANNHIFICVRVMLVACIFTHYTLGII